jgi:hypothetical protein
MNTQTSESSPSSHFLEEAKVAMGNLRSALLDLTADTGDDLAQPQELSRRYNVDKTLTWKISRIIRDQEIATSVVHVPGRRRMTTLLAAMRTGGATDKSVDAVWSAFDEFEKLVQKHSGDRGTLDIMVAGSSQRTPDRRLENLRKGGYQCNSAVWGVRARMHFGMHLMGPGAQEGKLAVSTICGFLGLERLRLGLPWTIADAVSWDERANSGWSLSPLHPDGLVDGTPLLPEFCSQPVPRLHTNQVDQKNRRYELPEGAIGLGHAVDITLGWSWPSTISMHASHEDEIGEHGILISTPVEYVVQDVWIHRSLAFAMNPRIRMYSKLPSGPRYPHEGRDAGLIPIPDTVIDLGYGAASSTMAEFPRSGELLQFAMNARGWKSSDFRGFRFKLKYPPIPTFAVFQHPLLPPPAGS